MKKPVRSVARLFVCILAAGVALCVRARDEGRLSTATLHYCDHIPEGYDARPDYDFPLSLHVSLDDELDVVFKAEPAYSGDAITRGCIHIQKENRQGLPFAIDRRDEKLYLDANINFDLTDDANDGTCVNQSGILRFDQTFQLDIDGRSIPYAIRLICDDDYVQATITSGWLGEIDVNGARWDFLFTDNLDGVPDINDSILIQSSRGAPFYTAPGQSFFFKGANRLIRCAWLDDDESGRPTIQVSMESNPVKTGRLMIDGRSIKALAFTGSQEITLDNPGTSATLPIGQYRVSYVEVVSEDGESAWCSWRQGAEVTIKPDADATLKIGAPLTSRIAIDDQIAMLEFNFDLTGVGGEIYGPLSYEDLPGFLIRQNGETIDSGQFEYG